MSLGKCKLKNKEIALQTYQNGPIPESGNQATKISLNKYPSIDE